MTKDFTTHSCGTKADGVLICWGLNDNGQLGADAQITSATPPAGTSGQPYSHTYATSGSPAPSFAVSSGGLPPGLSLNPSSGVLAGTPTTPGTYAGVVTASNGLFAPGSQSFSITITALQATPPVSVPSPAATATGERAAALKKCKKKKKGRARTKCKKKANLLPV